jgi:hypothetical protein
MIGLLRLIGENMGPGLAVFVVALFLTGPGPAFADDTAFFRPAATGTAMRLQAALDADVITRSRLRLTIGSVCRGTKHRDTCLAEIELKPHSRQYTPCPDWRH